MMNVSDFAESENHGAKTFRLRIAVSESLLDISLAGCCGRVARVVQKEARRLPRSHRDPTCLDSSKDSVGFCPFRQRAGRRCASHSLRSFRQNSVPTARTFSGVAAIALASLGRRQIAASAFRPAAQPPAGLLSFGQERQSVASPRGPTARAGSVSLGCLAQHFCFRHERARLRLRIGFAVRRPTQTKNFVGIVKASLRWLSAALTTPPDSVDNARSASSRRFLRKRGDDIPLLDYFWLQSFQRPECFSLQIFPCYLFDIPMLSRCYF